MIEIGMSVAAQESNYSTQGEWELRYPSTTSAAPARRLFTEVQDLIEYDASKGGLKLDAEDVMREIERLHAEGRPRLLGTLFFLMHTQEVRLDFSQVRAPTEEELAAVYDASPGIGSRLVTAYSDALTELRRAHSRAE